MKLHLRFDSSNEAHTRCTVFMNGANCGQLCMTTAEALAFHDTFAFGAEVTGLEFCASGKFFEGRVAEGAAE